MSFLCAEPWLALRQTLGLATFDATFEIPIPTRPSVHCRPKSSDLEVFWQVLTAEPYDWLERSDQPIRVIDAGANIGMATLAILERCPSASVIAIESDPGNYRMLMKNTRHVRERVSPVHAALWSRPGVVVLDDAPFRDGREWSSHVRSAATGETGAIAARDVPGILRDMNWPRVDVLKLDVEGAETEIFTTASNWIALVDLLAVELHDAEAQRAFNTLVGDRFSLERRGELTIGRLHRRDRGAP
jgi:FkbM family methyltransferase